MLQTPYGAQDSPTVTQPLGAMLRGPALDPALDLALDPALDPALAFSAPPCPLFHTGRTSLRLNTIK